MPCVQGKGLGKGKGKAKRHLLLQAGDVVGPRPLTEPIDVGAVPSRIAIACMWKTAGPARGTDAMPHVLSEYSLTVLNALASSPTQASQVKLPLEVGTRVECKWLANDNQYHAVKVIERRLLPGSTVHEYYVHYMGCESASMARAFTELLGWVGAGCMGCKSALCRALDFI